jgi:hypothetical protein
MTTRTYWGVGALLAATVAASGCTAFRRASPCEGGAAASPTGTALARVESRYDSIVVAIEAPVTVCDGTPLPMRFVLRNVAGRKITLTHMYKGFLTQFEIQDEGGVPLWDSRGPVPSSPVSLPLANADSLEQRGTWALTSRRNPPAGPGRYRVIGRALLEGGREWPQTPPIRFTIRAREDSQR